MDMNRGIFSRLLKGPTRLHSTSIARCETEIRRLEDTNAASVNSAIEIRVRELEALCHSTHLQVPRLSVILPSLYDTYAAGDCGQTKVSVFMLLHAVWLGKSICIVVLKINSWTYNI